MNTTPPGIIGTLDVAGSVGVVRIDTRFPSSVDDVWSACTDVTRLAAWYGPVEGELRPGGRIRIHVVSDGWYGTGRIEVCEPGCRLRLTTRESDESFEEGEGVAPFDEVIDITLDAVGSETAVHVEVSGIPLDGVAYYGVGWQLHAERLQAHLRGEAAPDAESRWTTLLPPYQVMAAALA
jgi:uncharacterized protein YndB with AHSA1/START domain